MGREFRGVWVASVSNLDWPSRPGLAADSQKAELLRIFEKVRALRMNAVVLQVRPAADALYASKLEPWSEYLSGTMGVPPVPYYDPLEFAVAEAHKRGLELHAWFNPYRARHPSARGPVSETHLSRTRPDIVHPYGKHLWMDPAEPDVQSHSLAVILDVVRRYDVDGVHIDDYFYPYQERDSANNIIPFPDDASWRRYVRGGGKLARDDFRRAAVDKFIEQLYKRVKQEKPWVKVGISPFGIWRPGFPEQVRGFDAYANLYADSRKWLNHGWLDYWAPQLYWSISAAEQSYPVLLKWWVSQNTKHRHVWAGNAPYRVRNDRQNWPPEEISNQIRLTREQPGASGNIYFSMRTLMRNQGGVADEILRMHTYFAIPPRSTWLDKKAPSAPEVSFDAARSALFIRGAAGEPAFWFVIYQKIDGLWYAEVISAQQAEYRVRNFEAAAVSAVDRNGNESRLTSLFPSLPE